MSLPLYHVALELEREGSKLFTALSQQTQDEGGRLTFLSLAKDEEEHITVLEKEIAKRQATREQLPPDMSARAADFRAKLLAALDTVKQRSRAAVTEDTSRIRALEVAAAMEDFICAFYRDAISQTESQHAKEFFLEMLQLERGHLELLEDSIAHLEEPDDSPIEGRSLEGH